MFTVLVIRVHRYTRTPLYAYTELYALYLSLVSVSLLLNYMYYSAALGAVAISTCTGCLPSGYPR